MTEVKKSHLYKLKPLVDRLPAVSKPDGHVKFTTKMLWTFSILVLYFVMTNVFIYGLDQKSVLDVFASFRAILAGASGSLMHLGIGPIVTGSIIMQLFTGAKIINLDLQKSEDKAIYQGTQKFLVIVMIFVEAIPQVYGLLVPSNSLISQLDTSVPGQGSNLARLIIISQLAAGSYLVFLMDEVVSKWGMGSGISLFIAAGVAQSIVTGTISWIPRQQTTVISVSNPPAGSLVKTAYVLTHMSLADLSRGGFESIAIAQPNPLVALISTMLVFLLVGYAESSSIELPLAHEKVRGARGRYPIRLIYASNIPVILMSALLANVNMFALLFWQHPFFSKWPLLGHSEWFGKFDLSQATSGSSAANTQPIDGIAYYVSTVQGVQEWLLPLFNPERYGSLLAGKEYWQVAAHVITWLVIMTLGSMMFARFWIDTTNMGSEAVARQIQQSGMQIPGFRRDPRVLKVVLDRYIPTVTLMSGAFVGLLAAGADLLGTVGNASGTGVLLMVGIIIRMYEQMGKETAIEMHPALRQFLGVEA